MVWPALAALSLAIAVGGREVTALGLILLCCGTMCTYGLDRLIDRRGVDSAATRRGLRIAVILSSMLALILACTALWRFMVCCVLGVLAGGYVPLKRIIPKNLVAVPAWTIGCCALPFATAPEINSHLIASALALALIVFANMVLCDIPNIEEDRRAKVRAFTTRFGGQAGAVFAGAMAILGAVIALLFQHIGLAVAAICLIPLAFILGRDPMNHRARLAVDEAVIFLPGPITLLMLSGLWIK